MPCATRELTIASPPVMEVMAVASWILVDDGVAEHAEALGFNLDDVAGFQPARRIEARAGAGRRARHDDVAGYKGREGRDIVDEITEAKDQPRRAILLPCLAIDSGGQADVGNLRFIGVGHDPRSEAARG